MQVQVREGGWPDDRGCAPSRTENRNAMVADLESEWAASRLVPRTGRRGRRLWRCLQRRRHDRTAYDGFAEDEADGVRKVFEVVAGDRLFAERALLGAIKGLLHGFDCA